MYIVDKESVLVVILDRRESANIVSIPKRPVSTDWVRLTFSVMFVDSCCNLDKAGGGDAGCQGL